MGTEERETVNATTSAFSLPFCNQDPVLNKTCVHLNFVALEGS